MKGTRYLTVLGVVVLTTLGCGQQTQEGEPAAQKAMESQVESEHGRASGSTTAPQGVPEDVPLYPGSESQLEVEVGSRGMLLTAETADSPKQVFEYMKVALTQHDWTVADEIRAGSEQMLTAKKQGRFIALTISSDGISTGISLAIANTQEGG